MNAHAFCRILLRGVMEDVRPLTTVQERRAAWPYVYDDNGHAEFHGPSGFYWHGTACCKWAARANGWSDWIDQGAKGDPVFDLGGGRSATARVRRNTEPQGCECSELDCIC